MAEAAHVQYMPTDEHINQEGRVLQKHYFVVSAYILTEGHMLFESHCFFSYKAAELTEL